MPTESKRELILQNLKTTLESIDGDDPYWNEVKSVKRLNVIPQDFEGEEKPGLMIVVSQAPEDIENQHGHHDRRTMKVGIVGVMDRPAGDEGAAVNRFMKDISIAVMADQTRGGYASATFKSFQQDHSNLYGDMCLFETELTIRYHCDGRTE